ncbi:MAG: hypothetical protein Q9219_004450 [cf. Caloplaca sp. 3 TL-2023]
MSLYYEAASFLAPSQEPVGSLMSRIFATKDLKSSPKQLYALVTETAKWSSILANIIESSELLQYERKLSPTIALLLVHDLLLSKAGIAAPVSHPLKAAVLKHKTRLSAQLARIRVRNGFATLDGMRASLAVERTGARRDADNLTSDDGEKRFTHPRWARVNTLKSTLEDQLQTTFFGYERVHQLRDILTAKSDTGCFYIDEHVPNLIALPPAADLTTTTGYRNGLIILQDKASCFPAYLLDPQAEDGACLDACAAPGNKTTHLASMMYERSHSTRTPQVWACERDKSRAATLTQMVRLAGCDGIVTVKAGQDFLLLDPEKTPWEDVGTLLLDPSCSGSGIIGRDETLAVTLPEKRTHLDNTQAKSRKRKREGKNAFQTLQNNTAEQGKEHEEAVDPVGESIQLSARLKALSAFQLRLLLHAFRFPSAKKISYSTCSIYAEENEHVVIDALRSPVAKLRNWRLLRRDEQVTGMQAWPIRGDSLACGKQIGEGSLAADKVAEACIRCRVGTEEGTQGFFAVAFVRDSSDVANRYNGSLDGLGPKDNEGDGAAEEGDEEWEGINESS